MTLRVTSIQAKNILGAEEFALEPGRATLISGRNGSGKSTRLAALQAALGGGSLAKIAHLKDGEPQEPEIVVVLDGDAGEHYRIERSAKGLSVKERVGDSQALKAINGPPQAFLDGLFDTVGCNPVRFLAAKAKDKAIMLLEALPLELDRKTLLKEMGITKAELTAMGAVPEGLHALEEIAKIQESVFKTRTGVNRDHKSKAQSAEQLKRAVPAVPPKDPGPEGDLEASIEALATAIAVVETKADAELEVALSAATVAYREAALTIETHTKDQSREFTAKYEAIARAEIVLVELNNAELLAAQDDSKDAAHEAARRTRAEVGDGIKAQTESLAKLREDLATHKAQKENAIQAEVLGRQIEEFEAAAEKHKTEGARLTKALDSLDAHRRKLTTDLPIEGLNISGPEITVHGIPLSQVNRAQEIAIAVQIAVLRAQGELPVVFLDGAEALDSEEFQLLEQELLKTNAQLFSCRVKDSDLAVETK